ncbi:hypothetical protein BVV20_02975 [Xanthomonas oryzae pv. oryzae]|nr:hypothetical protein BVV20_02975 [Xanthomonas oryzae pv. oryzae]
MICSSEKRFFTSNLLGIGNWTPSRCATQTWGDVAGYAKTITPILRHMRSPGGWRKASVCSDRPAESSLP